ncbi:MAG: hypothetical protein ACM3ZB_07465 [bacterium]|jgi:hypothetical protein
MRLARNAQIWFPGYARTSLRAFRAPLPERIWVAIADHFEPLWNGADERTGAERVRAWTRAWPGIASGFLDSSGRRPRYTFFYAQEQYRPALVEPLAAMAESGIADVEVHLHHDGEGEQDFVDRISSFTETLHSRHGLLRREGGRLAFAFIHGDWALDNSGRDGRHCGLNNEIDLLVRLGCYADFTMPSAPDVSQARLVNTIYWAVDDPLQPKSHDTGVPVTPGSVKPPGALLMIPGPLGIRWRGWLDGDHWHPRLETGELASYDLPAPGRVRVWRDTAPRIGGDMFLKLFTHGAPERNANALLSGGLARAFELLLNAASAAGQRIYFVSAWEMKNAVENARAHQTSRPALKAG